MRMAATRRVGRTQGVWWSSGVTGDRHGQLPGWRGGPEPLGRQRPLAARAALCADGLDGVEPPRVAQGGDEDVGPPTVNAYLTQRSVPISHIIECRSHTARPE